MFLFTVWLLQVHRSHICSEIAPRFVNQGSYFVRSRNVCLGSWWQLDRGMLHLIFWLGTHRLNLLITTQHQQYHTQAIRYKDIISAAIQASISKYQNCWELYICLQNGFLNDQQQKLIALSPFHSKALVFCHASALHPPFLILISVLDILNH